MIGVLVPAHNEAEHLDACLHSLAIAATHPKLRGESVHVVVALDTCSDASFDICLRHRVATVELQARCVGVARAAAARVLIAKGARWLASTDADSQVPSQWLVGQLEAGTDVFCGVVDLAELESQQAWLRSCFQHSERWGEGHGRIHGANLGISALSYQLSGGFAAQRCGEDVDLVRRLHAQGASICWAGDPIVTTSARLSGRAIGGFADYLAGLAALRTEVAAPLVLAS